MSSQKQASSCLGRSFPLMCSDADTCSCRRGKSTCTCCLACTRVHSDIVTQSASSAQVDASLAVVVTLFASIEPLDLQLSPGLCYLKPSGVGLVQMLKPAARQPALSRRLVAVPLSVVRTG